jgi:hypothetical protein
MYMLQLNVCTTIKKMSVEEGAWRKDGAGGEEV